MSRIPSIDDLNSKIARLTVQVDMLTKKDGIISQQLLDANSAIRHHLKENNQLKSIIAELNGMIAQYVHGTTDRMKTLEEENRLLKEQLFIAKTNAAVPVVDLRDRPRYYFFQKPPKALQGVIIPIQVLQQ